MPSPTWPHGVGREEDQTEGKVRIGVTPVVTGYFLTDLLSRFRKLFPKIEISLVEDKRSYIEHMLVGGELDMALLIVSNLEERSAIDHEVLLRSECRAWMAPGHALADIDGLSLADLENEPVVALALDELEGLIDGIWGKFDHPACRLPHQQHGRGAQPRGNGRGDHPAARSGLPPVEP